MRMGGQKQPLDEQLDLISREVARAFRHVTGDGAIHAENMAEFVRRQAIGIKQQAPHHSLYELRNRRFVARRDQVLLGKLRRSGFRRTKKLTDYLYRLFLIFFHYQSALQKHARAFLTIRRANCYKLRYEVGGQDHKETGLVGGDSWLTP